MDPISARLQNKESNFCILPGNEYFYKNSTNCKKTVHDWILNSSHVIICLIMNDCVKNNVPGKI